MRGFIRPLPAPHSTQKMSTDDVVKMAIRDMQNASMQMRVCEANYVACLTERNSQTRTGAGPSLGEVDRSVGPTTWKTDGANLYNTVWKDDDVGIRMMVSADKKETLISNTDKSFFMTGEKQADPVVANGNTIVEYWTMTEGRVWNGVIRDCGDIDASTVGTILNNPGRCVWVPRYNNGDFYVCTTSTRDQSFIVVRRERRNDIDRKRGENTTEPDQLEGQRTPSKRGREDWGQDSEERVRSAGLEDVALTDMSRTKRQNSDLGNKTLKI